MFVRKILFFPITFLWALILNLRHFLYDKNILKTYQPKVKSICVGNLEFGGTGKTPFIEYLINKKIQEKYKHIAVISRGYGRKNNDLIFVKTNHSALNVGDEPLQIKLKFGNKINMVVSPDKKKAIEKLLVEKPFTELILFDDAFQHRKIKANENILLTTYDKPFWKNNLFPSGTLRDVKNRAKDAHEIIITKCPEDFTKEKGNEFIKPIKQNYRGIDFKFSKIKYHLPRHVFNNREKKLTDFDCFLLVTGIANTKSLIDYFDKQNLNYKHLKFPDHHNFTLLDWNKIKSEFENLVIDKKAIITTEKDYIRFGKLETGILSFNLDILYLPITFEIL